MNGAQRLRNSYQDDARVRRELAARGWNVWELGAAIPDEARTELRRLPNAWLRWLPEYIAVHQTRTGVLLVDAKGVTAPNATTSNHAVELRSLYVAMAIGVRTIFCCRDGGAVDVNQLFSSKTGHCCRGCWDQFLQLHQYQQVPALPSYCPVHSQHGDNGSSTPYVLFRKTACIPLDAIFGRTDA